MPSRQDRAVVAMLDVAEQASREIPKRSRKGYGGRDKRPREMESNYLSHIPAADNSSCNSSYFNN